MSNILIVIPPHFGHINPTLGVGAELIKRGHSVTWLGFKPVPEPHFPVGGDYYVPKEFDDENAAVNAILSRQDDATNNTANKMIRWAFESTWLPFYEITVRHFAKVLERLGPDLVIHDEGLFGVAICCHLKIIPYVTSISSVPGLHYPPAHAVKTDDFIWLREVLSTIKGQHSIEEQAEVLNSPLANLIYTSREFVSGDVFPENYNFIGSAIQGRPSADGVNWNSINIQRKVIYVSTGSLLKEVKRQFYEKVILAFAEQDITVLITCPPELFNEWPENFTPQTTWPQLEVLSQVDAVVTAGGFNTINEALYYAKPLLVIPLANDQFGNADIVKAHGCGIKLRFRRLNVPKLQASVNQLLTDSSFREAANKMSKTLRAAGGSSAAADIIEKLTNDKER